MFTLKILVLKVFNRIVGFMLGLIKQRQPLLLAGPGCALTLCEDISRFGGTHVLLVTDKILLGLGLLDPIRNKLLDLGLKLTLFSDVEPDPDFGIVRQGVALGKRQGCDAILAVGGGSVIDVAKVLSAAIGIDADVKTLKGFMKVKAPVIPLYVAPTTSGTGSEVSIGAVITDEVTHKKDGVASPLLCPLVAALDPELMVGMPPSITAATGLDALTHAIEAFISRNATADSDRFSLVAIKLIFSNLETAYNKGSDLDARQSMAIASTYAGLAFTRVLVGYVHAISHALGGAYGIPHGLANGIVLPHILRYSMSAVPERFAEMAIAVGLGEPGEASLILGERFVDAVQDLNDSIGIPRTMDALRHEDMPAIASAALREAHTVYAVPRYMSQDDCLTILHQLKPVSAA